MKILMLGWEFPPIYSGGLGVVCKKLATALGKKGLDLTFALPYFVRRKLPEHEIPKDFSLLDFPEEIQKIAIKYIPTSLPSPYTNEKEYNTEWESFSVPQENFFSFSNEVYGKNLWQEIDRFARQMEKMVRGQKFDAIHAHDWITFEAGVRLKHCFDIPLITHVHATEIDRTGGNPNPETFHREKYAFEKADRVITVSEYTKNILVDHYGTDPEKIRVVHNAHLHTSQHHQTLTRDFPHKRKGETYVLFIGRVTIQKGPDYFLDVAKKVVAKDKNVKFFIVGNGDMLPRITHEIAKERLQNNVFCLGFVDGEAKKKIWEQMDLCIVPSVSEPFGLTVLEAVEHGVPVVVSHNAGAKEVVSNSLKVDFWDTKQMAEYVMAVSKHPVLQKVLAQKAHRETRGLNWHDQAGKVHEIYEELACC